MVTEKIRLKILELEKARDSYMTVDQHMNAMLVHGQIQILEWVLDEK